VTGDPPDDLLARLAALDGRYAGALGAADGADASAAPSERSRRRAARTVEAWRRAAASALPAVDDRQLARASEVFESALDLAAGERRGFAAVLCSNEPDVLACVEALLAADAEAGEPPAAGALPPPTDEPPAPEPAPPARTPARTIGPYTIVRELGAGGMGTVYEAVQERPHRRVALKVMNLALSTPDARRRFEYESELLAELGHPGVAQVWASGTHVERVGPQEREVPWFALEFVEDARTLLEYADHHALSVADRIGLFLQACAAVEHGHQKGVIHRDLKPGNLLVDGTGRVRVIDFGVARAVGPRARELTLQTEAGRVLGTLTHMSPEQLDGRAAPPDVRSDVYALGVCLYELVCGRLPYDVDERTALHATARMICEERPRRPSAVAPAVAGDLEVICLKALEKEPRRRYASVGALADDLRRYLARQPIEARPAGALYQLRLFARRNRVLVAVSLGLLVALVTAAVASTRAAVASRRAAAASERAVAVTRRAEAEVRAERDAALAARDAEARERVRAERAEAEAEARRREAEEEARKSAAVTDYLVEMLGSAHPLRAGRDVRVTDFLAFADHSLDERFPDYPDVRASLRGVIGSTYSGLGLLAEAEGPLRAALAQLTELAGADDAETLATARNLAFVLEGQGRLEEAEATLARALEGARDTLGEDHREVLACRALEASFRTERGDYAAAAATYREVLAALEPAATTDPEAADRRLRYQLDFARLLLIQDALAEAEPLVTSALAEHVERFGERHPRTLIAKHNRAELALRRGDLETCAALQREIYAARRDGLGERHARTIAALYALADVLRQLGRTAEAEPLLRRAVELQVETFGEEQQDVPTMLNALAALLQQTGRLAEAEATYRRSLDLGARALGAGHPRTHMTAQNLASVLWLQGRADEAEPLSRASCEGLAATLGGEHPLALAARSQRASLLASLGRVDEADALLRDAFEAQTRVLGPDHPDRLQSLNYLGHFALRRGAPADAEGSFRDAYRRQRRLLGLHHAETLSSLGGLLEATLALGRTEEARELARDLLEGRRAVLGEEHPQTRAARAVLEGL